LDSKLVAIVAVEDTIVAIEKADYNDTESATESVDLRRLQWVVDLKLDQQPCG
jgi:hypothetical protein